MADSTLILLRHGESEWNALNLFTGWVDVDLTDKGRAEAARAGELIKELDRQPDENHEGVYRFLLKRNRRLYGVAYTLDKVGDIYLIGRIARDAVSADELDRILGQVLDAVDTDFNKLLELGFKSSIQKEWAWRVARGESLKNLEAFEHLIADDEDD